MKKIITILAILFIATTTFAQGTWTQKANFTGAARAYVPVGFAIGTKGYVGLGYNGSSYYQDLREWNSANDTWTTKANFFSTRDLAISFVIGNKGYVGTGNIASTTFNDIWQYDTTSNSWTQKANIPGATRVQAFAFSINGNGYLGGGAAATGSSTVYNDFYQYDTALNIWTAKATFATIGRTGACGFALNGKGYMGLGYLSGNHNDMWEYDPTLDSWTQKGNFAGVARNSAQYFVIGNYAYVGGGYDGSNDKQDFWQWEPITDIWVAKANLGGGTRTSGVGYAISGKGYIVCGRYNGNYTNTYWEYDPNISVGVTFETQEESIRIYPNPFSTSATITFTEEQKNTLVVITDVLGKEIKTINFSGRELVIDKADLSTCQTSMEGGVYFVQTIDNKKKIINTKVIIE